VARTVLTLDDFSPEAEALRGVFDERFEDPRSARGDRFQWDWWHVPGQYTALRTPAWTYFPKPLYSRFHRRLVQWGRDNLGCHDISPPWLSCYIDGCVQHLHGDLPHGPWAFVFSLTRWKERVFRGGETVLLRDEVLDFWSGFESVRGVEEPDVLRAIPPRFGRLVAFDPRIPHGVREVRGTHDPREGRLVIHGWFVQPKPVVVGPLRDADLRRCVDELSETILGRLLGDLPVAGLLSLGFRVSARGVVSAVQVLSDNTRVPAAEERARRRFVAAIRRAVEAWSMPAQTGPSRVTLPLTFAQG